MKIEQQCTCTDDAAVVLADSTVKISAARLAPQAAGAAERAATAGAAAARVLAGGSCGEAGLQGHPVRAEGASDSPLHAAPPCSPAFASSLGTGHVIKRTAVTGRKGVLATVEFVFQSMLQAEQERCWQQRRRTLSVE